MNVNEPLHSESELRERVSRHDVPGSSGVSVSAPTGAPEVPLIVAPDPSLPLPSERPPVTFTPDPPLMSWAVEALDTVEWTEEQRKAIVAKFSTVPEYDHVFTAVPTPECFIEAMEDPVQVKRDFLLKRKVADDFFFEGSQDLCCSSRLLLDAMDGLRIMSESPNDKGEVVVDVQDLHDMRDQLARVFHGMASNMSKSSRGRRELCRRFVLLDVAPTMYAKKPSHTSLFGEGSFNEASDRAVEASTANKNVVVMPKKTPQPFRGAGSWGKSSWASNWKSRTQKKYGKSQPQPSKFGNQKWKKVKRGRGRGRGRSKKTAKE